jgi:hypothetical protein
MGEQPDRPHATSTLRWLTTGQSTRLFLRGQHHRHRFLHRLLIHPIKPQNQLKTLDLAWNGFGMEQLGLFDSLVKMTTNQAPAAVPVEAVIREQAREQALLVQELEAVLAIQAKAAEVQAQAAGLVAAK